MGTEVAPDGKVAALRLVNVDATDDSGAKLPSTCSSKGLLHRSNKVDKTRRLIHTLEVGDPTIVPGTAEWDAEPKVCVLHGYGAGSAFFFQNTKALAQAAMPSFDGSTTVSNRLFALDWLGMGRSARVPFRPKSDLLEDEESVPSRATDGNGGKQWAPGTPDLLNRRRVHAAEDFFLDSFEAWRRTMQIERLVLVGHSLGAYLSLAYTLKYPERVDRLVLVSPAAIGISTFLTCSGESLFICMLLTSHPFCSDPATITPADKSYPHGADGNGSETNRGGQTRQGLLRKVATFLWERNLSPFSIVRGSLFAGPKLVSTYTLRRFGHLPAEELNAMHVYAHGIFVAPGSSEYALNFLLAPGAWARWPAISRVQQALSGLPAATQQRTIKDVPISLIYGSDDWMNPASGQSLVELLRSNGAPKASIYVVPKAGHNVFLDAPTHFNQLITSLLRAPTRSAGSTSLFPRELDPDNQVSDDHQTARLCAAWERL